MFNCRNLFNVFCNNFMMYFKNFKQTFQLKAFKKEEGEE